MNGLFPRLSALAAVALLLVQLSTGAGVEHAVTTAAVTGLVTYGVLLACLAAARRALARPRPTPADPTD